MSVVKVVLDLRKNSEQSVDVLIEFYPKNHYINLILPSWTPGSYTIRDHVQYLHSLTAEQNESKLDLVNKAPALWFSKLKSLGCVKVSYTVEAKQLSVRESFINEDFASICLPSVLIMPKDNRNELYELELLCPKDWNTYSPLSNTSLIKAKNYDELVDCPIHAGSYNTHELIVKGFNQRILIIGKTPNLIINTFLKDIELICSSACDIFREEPPSRDKYIFILLMLENCYGGLEHDNSTVLHYSWRDLYTDSGYRKLLQLIGHEYLHQWNIRRLRPKEYIEYDYSKAILSENLWFVEGITSYFDLTLPFLSGISSKASLLEDLSEDISDVLITPGRNIQSLKDSSLEAWVKLYKAKSYSKDYQISYYKLGCVTSLCLDILLRQQNSSLAELLRELWLNFGVISIPYTRDDIFQSVLKISQSVCNELNIWIDEPNSIDIKKILYLIGLEVIPIFDETPFTGITYEPIDDNCIINRVQKGSPANIAGLSVYDEIISIDDLRVRKPSDINRLLSIQKESLITYCRFGYIKTTTIMPKSPEPSKWVLKEIDNPTSKQINLFNNWIKFI